MISGCVNIDALVLIADGACCQALRSTLPQSLTWTARSLNFGFPVLSKDVLSALKSIAAGLSLSGKLLT
jgi:hypothetical protein